MKNKEVLILNSALKSLDSVKGDVKFTFAVAMNKTKVEAVVESLAVSIKPSEDFESYDNARIELAKKHSRKGEDGEALTIKVEGNEAFDIVDVVIWEKAWNKLKTKNKSAIELRDKQINQYNEALEEEADISDLVVVDLDHVPELEAGLVRILLPMLKG